MADSKVEIADLKENAQEREPWLSNNLSKLKEEYATSKKER